MAGDPAAVDEPLEVDNLTLAAFLVYEGHTFLGFSWEGKQCYFLFPHTTEVQDCVIKYVGGQALVDPKEFAKTHQQLKVDMFRSHPSPPARKIKGQQ